MCGIAGVFHRDPQQPIDSQLLVNMAAIQYHRGPDNFGYANPPGLGLGLSHARLSIIDLNEERGRQPLVSPDQQYYLQQNMHLMLEQAQVALLRKQDDLYKHSLSRVAGWLDEYLLIDDQRTVAAKLALQELQGWQVNPPLPDITGSLMQLQKLVENQRRGSVLPRQPAPANEAADGGNQ